MATNILTDADFENNDVDFDNYEKKADRYLKRDAFSGTSLSASAIRNAAEETYNKTGKLIPVEFVLAQGQDETQLGKKLKSKNNFFNVGNFDDGRTRSFDTPEAGVKAYTDLLANDYLVNKDPEDLLNNFVNKNNKRYASDRDYEKKLRDNMDLIGGFTNAEEIQSSLIKKGYDPGPVDGDFGPKTENALRKFQKDRGLKADGLPGPKTKNSLFSMIDDAIFPSANAAEVLTDADFEEQPKAESKPLTDDDFLTDADFEADSQAITQDQPIPSTKQRNLGDNALEVAKGGVRGLQGVASGAGGLIDMAGQNIQREADRMLFVNNPDISKEERSKKSESLRKIGLKVSEWGKTAKDFWTKASQEGIAAPDEKMFTGTFMQNPSWTRAATIVSEAVPSLGAATAASMAAGGNPMVGLAFLGAIQGEQTFAEARSAGKSVDDANMYFGLSAIGTSVFENLPLTRFLKGGEGKLVKDMFVGAAQEGAEEGVQQLWTNVIARIGYDKTRSLTEGMVESVIGGAGSGGVIGGLTSGRTTKIDKEIKQALDAGVPQVAIDAMQEAIANQIVAHADVVETAITEKPAVKIEEVSTDVGIKKTVDVNVTPEMKDAVDSGLPAIEVKPEIEATLEKPNLSEERRSAIIKLLETPEKPTDTGTQPEVVTEPETKPTTPVEAKGEEQTPPINLGEDVSRGTLKKEEAPSVNQDQARVEGNTGDEEVKPQDFKTAEEYVASKTPMYQGGGKEFKIEGRIGGVYLTKSKKYAETFKGKEGEIAEAYAEPKNPFDLTEQVEMQPERELLIEAPQNFLNEIKRLREQGYDAITYKDQVLILDPSIVKTKSQLTAEWQAAQVKEGQAKGKPTTVKPLNKPKAPVTEPAKKEAEKKVEAPVVETDLARIQEIKNSIAEGEMILKSGKDVSGKKMTEGALESVKRSVENSKKKIGKGSSGASVGTFSEEILQGSTVEAGKKEAEIKPVSVIEMVKLAKMLMDEYPTLKKFPKAWGMFYGQGKGSIKLTPELFKAGKEKQLAATLAHEIGHLVDYMPDSTLKRGNVLGRLASLKQYLKTFLPKIMGSGPLSLTPQDRTRIRKEVDTVMWDKPNGKTELAYWKQAFSKAYADAIKKEADKRGLISHKDIRNEMIDLSFEWRPVEDGLDDASYMAYRSSSKELYADFVSAMLNSPAYVKTKAPETYDLFFEYLDKKPEFKKAYLYMEQIMQGRPADLMEIRLEDRRTMFAKGEQAREMLDEEAKAARKDTWQNIRQLLDDRFYPITKKLNRQKRDAIVPSSEAVHLLREQGMWQVDAYKYVQQVDTDAVTPMLKTGATTQDLGDYMYLRRVIGKAEIDKNADIAKAINTANEEVINALRAQGYEISDNLKDREQLANPLGYTPDSAKEALDFLKTKLTPEQWASIVEADKKYREITFKIVQEAADEGVYNKKVFEDIILPNKETYASFGVLDYITDNVAAGIKASKGTLKEIENPFITTTLKTVSLKRLIARNKATKATIEELSSMYPGDITESKRMFNAAGPTGYMKAPIGRGQVKYLVDGKVVSFDVDPYIAKSMENDDTQIIEMAAAFNKWSGNNFFRNLVITFNPAFQVFNVGRDFGRSYVNLNALMSEKGRSVSISDVLKAYYKAIPLAVKRNSGVSDKQLDEMMSHKALGIPFNDYNVDDRDDGFARILRKYKVVGENMEAKTIREKLVKGWGQVDSAVRFVGNILETLPKVAGYNILKEKGVSDREIGFLTRTYLGTPDIQTSGKWTKLTNQIFTFSNVTIQGAKADIRLAINPTTAAGWHLANFKISVMPMLVMAAAILGFAGKDLEDWFEKVPEFDKTNYIIVPLGVDDDGRSVYARLPHNQTSRITTAILYKVLTAGKNKVDGIGGAIDITASQLPSLAPILTTLGAWGAYMQGQNPQDMFRGRPILSEKAYDAGGFPALSKMVQYTFNNYGFSQFTTYDDRRNTTFEATMQATPFVSALSRIVKTTDYGLVEKGWAISKEAKRETAQRSLERTELFDKQLKGLKSAEISRLLDENGNIKSSSKLKSDLRYITETLYDGKPDKEDFKATEKAFIKYALKEMGSPWINVFLSAQSNEDKASVLIQAKDSMKPERYNEIFNKLQRTGLITDGLRKEINKAKMQNNRP